MSVAHSSTPMSTEALAATRRLMTGIEADALAVEQAFAQIPVALLDGARWKGDVGSQRGIDRLIKAAPREPDYRGRRVVAWRYAAVLPAVPGDDGRPVQRCVVIKGVIAQHKKSYRPPSLFGIAFTAHAISRLYQRAGLNIDAMAALFEGHSALATLNANEGEAVYALSEVVLPAGAGFFIGKGRIVGKERSPLLVARTWIANEMETGRRISLAESWRALLR